VAAGEIFDKIEIVRNVTIFGVNSDTCTTRQNHIDPLLLAMEQTRAASSAIFISTINFTAAFPADVDADFRRRGEVSAPLRDKK